MRPYPQKIDRKKKDAEIAKQQEQRNCVWQPNKKVQVNKVTKDVRVHQVRKQGKATRRASEDEEWEQLIDIVEHEQTNTSLNTLNRNLLCIAAQPTRRVNNDNQQQQNNQQQQGRPEENQGEPNHATFPPIRGLCTFCGMKLNLAWAAGNQQGNSQLKRGAESSAHTMDQKLCGTRCH